eukprot:NODE_9644_length_221_cov_10.779070_g8484_i0.p1 GENE.NODE_9644_length_221_cov_10.779070_g8484_i0~~NODE_9644_length_221_cov_10.779070_g8484_i0.p1  ORF type:complete len:72 (+),score=70.85 NODE_9644_length_221_cov_10.779070_g8484_i0:25-216(+)
MGIVCCIPLVVETPAPPDTYCIPCDVLCLFLKKKKKKKKLCVYSRVFFFFFFFFLKYGTTHYM